MTNQEIIDTINSAIEKAAGGLADGAFKNPGRVVDSIADLCNRVRYFKGEEPLRANGETVEPVAEEAAESIA